MNWSTQNAPANHNALIMWDHGGGPFGFNYDTEDGITASIFSTSKLVSALNNIKTEGTNIDLLAFDECLMASAEVTYELKDLASVLVTSEEVIPGDGYNYHKAFEALQSNPESVSAEQLAASMVTAYNDKYKGNEDNTLSAIKTSELGDLATALKAFTTATQEATSADWVVINQARADSTHFEYRFLHDLGKFASNLASATGLTSSIQAAAGQVIQAVEAAVLVQTEASKAKTTGLSIFLPNDATEYNNQVTDPKLNYFENHAAFMAATGWNTFLQAYDTNVLSKPDAPKEDIKEEDQPDQPIDLSTGGWNVLAVQHSLSSIDTEDTLSFKTGGLGTADSQVVLYSSNPDAVITVKLQNENQETLTTISGQEKITLNLSEQPAGIYSLKISSPTNVSRYDVYTNTPTQDSFDGFLGNDLLEEASPIDESVPYNGLKLVDTASDWYEFQTSRSPATDEGVVTVYLAENDRPVTVNLYLSGEESPFTSVTGKGEVKVKYLNSPATDYLIEVTQPDSDNKSPLGYALDAYPVDPGYSPILGTAGTNQTLLEIDQDLTQANVQFLLTEKTVQPGQINELGAFVVDDAEGRIDGLLPGKTGYTEAALSQAQVIFSVLPDNFIEKPRRILQNLDGKLLSFYLVQNGTRDEVLNDPTKQNQVLFGTNTDTSSSSLLQISGLTAGQFSLNFNDQQDNTVNNLTLTSQLTDTTIPLGSSSLQGKTERELIDLTEDTEDTLVGQKVTVEFPTIASEAGYQNTVGFYRVENEEGVVRDSLTGGLLNPSDSGYVKAALKLSSEEGKGISFTTQQNNVNTLFDGGFLYAPYLIANGTIGQILDNDATNNVPVYFAYLGANSDKVDHVRLLGDNTWGFEDLLGGGDQDYNDIVIQGKFTV